MKSVSQIIQEARLTTGAPINESYLDDVTLLGLLNSVYQEISDYITKTDAGYFQSQHTTHFLEGITTYTLKDADTSFKDIYMVETADSNGTYTKLPSSSYTFRGNALILQNPATSYVADGLRITVTENLPDLEHDTQGSELFGGYGELQGADRILVEGLRVKIFQIKEEENKASLALSQYEKQRKRFISGIAARNDGGFMVNLLSS